MPKPGWVLTVALTGCCASARAENRAESNEIDTVEIIDIAPLANVGTPQARISHRVVVEAGWKRAGVGLGTRAAAVLYSWWIRGIGAKASRSWLVGDERSWRVDVSVS